MRKVVGARRADIIRQFLGESVFFSLLAFIIALFLVDLFLPVFNSLQGKEMTLFASGNLFIYLILVLVAVASGIVSGSYPALFLSAFQPVKVLKKDLTRGRKGSIFRTVLVISQFSVSVLLVILTIVAYRQMLHLRNAELGFSRNQIVHIQMNDDLRASYKTFKDRLLRDYQCDFSLCSAPPPVQCQ